MTSENNVIALPQHKPTSKDIHNGILNTALSRTFQHHNIAVDTVCKAAFKIICHNNNLTNRSYESSEKKLVSVAYLNRYTVKPLVYGQSIRLSFESYEYDLHIKSIHAELFDAMIESLEGESEINRRMAIEFKEGKRPSALNKNNAFT